MAEQWSILSQCEVMGGAPVIRLKSPNGLRLTVIQAEGPLVATYIVLATEVLDDDGLPHTLEHLVFLGSEDYPYKGLLDIFANKCFASGTNARTDTDHTEYTLMTAGAKGTLKMLPVYMDHILYPLLTEEGYTTEIHHVTGEGKDAGVVYSEMQGSENSANNRIYRKLLQAAYPESGYSSTTGGVLENLRNSTNNEKVRKYHKDFYKPENIVIIVVGQIDYKDVIASLQPIENKIHEKVSDNLPFVQPWKSPVPPIKSYESIIEKYPTDSEDSGLIMVGWRGPKILSQQGFYEFTACCIILRYLSETPISPLQKALVDIENPFASDISLDFIEYSVTLLMLTFENVPMNKLNETLPELKKIIKNIASSPDSLNMDRLNAVVEKQLRKTLSRIENSPHDTLSFSCIKDFLYSSTNEQFEEMLNNQKLLERLLKESDVFWRDLYLKYFDTDFVSVIGSPSTNLMMQLTEEENQRIIKHKEELGEEGLEKKTLALKKAMEYNDREAPMSIFEAFGSIDCNDLKTFSLDTWTTEDSACPYFDIKELPFYSRINHINSQFTYITLLINTCDLEPEEQLHLPLLLELLPQSPYLLNDITKEHSDLIEEIELLTNKLNFNIGVGSADGKFCTGEFQQTITFYIQSEPKKYEKVVELAWKILKKTIFTKFRALVVAQKMVKDISTIRREGDRLVSDLLNDMIFTKKSNTHQCSLLRQQKFLTNILKKLQEPNESCSEILNNLSKIRDKLFAENNVWLHFAADLKTNNFSSEPWKKYPIQVAKNVHFANLVQCGTIVGDSSYLLEREYIQGQGCVVGIGGLESCYVKQYSPGPFSHSHPDIPALLVALRYFTQHEGLMWRHIRGSGLSYDYSIDLKPDEGFIEFNLYKATNGVQAYIEAKNIIETFLNNEEWDDNLFSSAKSTLVFELVDEESSLKKLIKLSLLCYCKNIDLKYNVEMVQKVMKLNKDDLTKAAKRWLPGLFNPKFSTLVVVCNPAKANEMKASFEGIGFENLKVSKSLEDSHMNDE